MRAAQGKKPRRELTLATNSTRGHALAPLVVEVNSRHAEHVVDEPSARRFEELAERQVRCGSLLYEIGPSVG